MMAQTLGTFIYMQLDDNEENVPLWDNISYAIATTAKEAYSFEKNKELPSPLENIGRFFDRDFH